MKNIQKETRWLLKEKYPQLPVPLKPDGVRVSNGKLTKAAIKDINRLKRGEPLDYVIGFTEFLGCKIDLSKKPLIPRPETEYWVEKAIEQVGSPSTRYAGSGQNLRILDMFAGSGCIGIAVLKHLTNAKVVFAEKDKNFLKQIEINCKLNNIRKKRYKIIKSDIFSVKPNTSILQSIEVFKKYDYILANPSYIAKIRKNKIQRSVLKYEPKSALFGGQNGLFYIRKFLAEAKNFLKPEGRIFMEFDYVQKSKIEKLLRKYCYEKIEFHKDQFGKLRYLITR